VYLFLVVVPLLPRANIPLVTFPEAEPRFEAALDDVVTEFASVENIYLFLVRVDPPSANIPTSPVTGDVFFLKLNPNAIADIAPRVITAGIIYLT